MMKSFGVILLLVLTRCVYAQQIPALLSIEGIGGNGRDDVSQSVLPTADGGFILSIGTTSTIGPILCDTTPTVTVLMKYNADGSVLEWKKCFTSGYLRLFPTADGNFIAGGHGNFDFYISKIDPAGNTIWIKYYGGSNDEIPRDMMATPDGGYIMFGESNSNDGDVGYHHGGQFNADLWAIKLDSSGNKVWSTVLGGTDEESAYSVVRGPGNSCYLMGTTVSTDDDCTDNHGDEDVLVTRLDDSGHVIWHKCFGGSGTDGYYKYANANTDNKGGILTTVASNSNDGDVHGHIGGEDYWVADIDSSNHIIWDNCFGGTGTDAPLAVVKSLDGSIWVCGASRSTDGEVYVSYGLGDALIVHIDSAGHFLGSKVLGEAQGDEGTMVYSLTGGMVLVGGTYEAGGPVGGEFPSDYYGGATDLFLARLAPWTTDVRQVLMGNDQIIAYPNPANDIVNVKSKNGGLYKITIKDIRGQTLYSADNVNNQTEIDVRNWPRGLYFVELVNGQGHNAVQKIIVE